MRRALGLLAFGIGMGATGSVAAQEITAGGAISGHVGYGSNPYLQPDAPGGSVLVGGSLSGWLQRRSETATTRLTGVASLDRYTSRYGSLENYLASLSHVQKFSDRLSLTADLAYQDSINARGFNTFGGTDLDLLSVGQRTRTIYGNALLNWQPTSRDSFYIGPQFSRSTYPRSVVSDYTQYGLRGGYLRTINARLKIGIDVVAQRVNSDGFPNSDSVQVSPRLVYDFNEIWTFDGSVGLIHQKVGSPLNDTNNTIGFTARLCGKYPRYRMCFEGSRQSAPSGFGGLRTDNRASATLDYDLSSRSKLTASALYDRSTSTTGFSAIPRQEYWELSAGYSRVLTQRLSAGVSGRYQNRDFGNFPGLTDSKVSGYSVTLDATYKFGRLE